MSAGKALLLYASTTGNTELIAKTFHDTLLDYDWQCTSVKLTESTDLAGQGIFFDHFDLLLLGSPVVTNAPSPLVTQHLALVAQEPPRLYSSPFFFPGSPYKPDDVPLGVIFSTYSGETFGPHESLSTLNMLQTYLEYYYVDIIGKFACPGKKMAKDTLFILAEEMGGSIQDATKLFSIYSADPTAPELDGQSEEVLALLAELLRDKEVPSRALRSPEFSVSWHTDLQTRPNQRDLKKAEIFLQEVLEGYFSGEPQPKYVKSVYTCIG